MMRRKCLNVSQICWMLLFLLGFTLIVLAAVLCSEFLWLKKHLVKSKVVDSFTADVGESKVINLKYRPFLFQSLSMDAVFPNEGNESTYEVVLYRTTSFTSQINSSSAMEWTWNLGTLGAFNNVGKSDSQSFEYLNIPMNPGSTFTLEYSYTYKSASYGKVMLEINDIFPSDLLCACENDTSCNCTFTYTTSGWPNKQHTLGFVYYYSYENGKILSPDTFSGSARLSLQQSVWIPTHSVASQQCDIGQTIVSCTIPLSWVGRSHFMSVMIQQKPSDRVITSSNSPAVSITINSPVQRYWLHVFMMVAPPLLLILVFFVLECLCCCLCMREPKTEETQKLIYKHSKINR